MSRSPRAEALHLIGSGEPVPEPDVSDLRPMSAEALDFIDACKPAHYVALARAIDILLARVITPSNKKQLSSMDESLTRGNTGWINLSSRLRDRLIQASEKIARTPEYQAAEAFTEIRGKLDPDREIKLDHQLSSGIGTAVITTIPFLKNLSHIIGSHVRPGEQLDIASVGRHPRSSILLSRLAKSSINHSVAAQTALEGVATAHSWQDEMLDIVLQPHHFKLNRYGDNSLSVDYADFAGLTVPAGYRLSKQLPAVREPTLAKDMANPNIPVVGCPITLLPGRLTEFWQWTLDLVEANGLWGEE